MIPQGNLDDLFYPMTADVYYARQKQTDYGNVEKSWYFDRTINCSAITALSDRTFMAELKYKNKSVDYNSNIYFRTNEDVRLKSNGDYYPITSIFITNIKDPSGQLAWLEPDTIKYTDEVVKTIYEVLTVVPSFDIDHNIGMYRIYLTRSQKQSGDFYQ